MPSGETHFTQQEWLTKYGGVVGIMMGPRPGLFIQGAPYVQDALKKPEFQGRPHTADFKERSFGKFLGEIIFHKISGHKNRTFLSEIGTISSLLNLISPLLKEKTGISSNLQTLGGAVYTKPLENGALSTIEDLAFGN
jgi:Cytochrome P450.